MKEVFTREFDMNNIVNSVFTYDDFEAVSLPPSNLVREPNFIVGSPRSGTTILSKCLNQSDELSAADESLFMIMLWRIYADLHQSADKNRSVPLGEYIDSTAILTAMQEFSDKIISSLTRKTSEQARFLDHTPWYGALAPFISSFYPDARFIHIVRDGRNAVQSLTRAYEKGYRWAGEDIAARTHLWMQSVLKGRKIKDKMSDQYHELRYERLCSEPIETIKEISDFLKIDYASNMVSPFQEPVSSPSRDNATFDPERPKTIEELVKIPTGWTESDERDFMEIAEELQGSLAQEIT